jgi:threonine dehydrogenase-like Zn-dependent dehydrogenase
MLSAVLHEPNRLELVTRDVPEPGPGDILLKIEATTLCGTDIRILDGSKTAGVRPGVTPGHEIAGRIAALGPGVTGYEVGQQATVAIVVSCNRCRACLNDREHLCADLALFGYGIDGGLAEYMLVPADVVAKGNVMTTSTEIPATTLALSEPVSCCLNGFDQYAAGPGDTVVILGAGPIGLLHTQLAAKMAGARQVIVSNRSAARREAALVCGATHAVDPTATDLAAFVQGATDGAGADVVVVCIGGIDLANVALDLAGIGGRVSYFAGFPKGSTAVMDPNLIHYKELVVTGGSNARRRDVRRAISVLESGLIDAAPIVSHRFPLQDLYAAYDALKQRTGVKIAVLP